MSAPVPIRLSRYQFIDTARGICLIWMTLAHVTSSVEGGSTSFLTYFFPAGWSTTIFVMLTGLALALITLQNKESESKHKKWNRRAVQILLVGYVTNTILLLMLAIGEGVTVNTSLIAGILLFQKPWTVNAILLPSAVLLLLIPSLNAMRDKTAPHWFFAGITILFWGVWHFLSNIPEATPHSFFFSSLFLFDNPWFGYPLAYLLSLGIWAFAFGSLFSETKICYLPFAVSVLASLGIVSETSAFLLFLFRFGITLGTAVIFERMAFLVKTLEFPRVLGRSSLFFFVSQQLVLQCILLVWPADLTLPFGISKTLTVFTFTLGICGALTLLRDKNQRFKSTLVRVGL